MTLAGSLAAGLAALAGALADWFTARELALTFQWTSPGETRQVTLLQFRHWEFLFATSFALGFYVLHRLSRIPEGEEHSERTVGAAVRDRGVPLHRPFVQIRRDFMEFIAPCMVE